MFITYFKLANIVQSSQHNSGCMYSDVLIRKNIQPSHSFLLRKVWALLLWLSPAITRTDVPFLNSLSRIEEVYDNVPAANARFEELNALFKEKYGCMPEFYVRAPGRVNLIGEHIDYHKYRCKSSLIHALAILFSLWLLPTTWLWLLLRRRIPMVPLSFLFIMWYGLNLEVGLTS